jgi:hypothetical protein
MLVRYRRMLDSVALSRLLTIHILESLSMGKSRLQTQNKPKYQRLWCFKSTNYKVWCVLGLFTQNAERSIVVASSNEMTR